MSDDMKKYIQLPPMERTVDSRVIQALWAYAQLPAEAKKKVYEDMKKVQGEEVQVAETISQHYEKIEYSQIADFQNTMMDVIRGITKEACELAGWVYCKKYIEKMTLKEMIEQMPTAESFIFVLDTWFERYQGEH